jgi:hypothetical protein
MVVVSSVRICFVMQFWVRILLVLHCYQFHNKMDNTQIWRTKSPSESHAIFSWINTWRICLRQLLERGKRDISDTHIYFLDFLTSCRRSPLLIRNEMESNIRERGLGRGREWGIQFPKPNSPNLIRIKLSILPFPLP